ncbi:MAG TPA: Gfo/Idh/MocA family oxidoreductase [Verrucomicrobiae bacterium]|jgi:predicted dehydrogenase|nr:Gfo/Idh/MocA family oxidoreductase [Verrucomicrobiae bacterium]
MSNSLSRRDFIKRTALAAGAASTAGFITQSAWAAPRPLGGDKLNCVQVGCGGRAMSHLDAVIGTNAQNLYAIVDADETQFAKVMKWLKKKNLDSIKPQFFTDYRVMYDKIGKNVDAVFVTTPNHHHATVAMMAIQAGRNVYCEKPLVHDVSEARRLRKMAADNPKIATQMGNQGHCEEGYRRLCEYIWSGAIGNITETHSWTDRANGGIGPRPPVLPVPKGMNWDSWIGPAPYRDFHSDLHPHEWHGWYDFGNGSIGNMGCHILDGVFWALKVGDPDSIEVEVQRGGSPERYPTGCRLRWDIPAREGMVPFKAYWYEGLNQNTSASADGSLRTAKGDSRNLPPLFKELQAKYPDEEFDSNGTFYVGDKGILYTGTYGEHMRMVPREKMTEMPAPPKTLPRPKDVFTNFVQTCLAGRTDTATPFEYGARLTEFAILGNLAQHIGPGVKLEWDGPNMKVKNIPALSAWLHRNPREGWAV